MSVPAPQSYKLGGAEKERYLAGLDAALDVLARNIETLPNEHQPRLIALGNAKGWDWSRLPRQDRTYSTLTGMVKRVRQEYQWFRTIDDVAEPGRNRALFDGIEVSTESGMPWVFDFVRLSNVKKQAAVQLDQLPDYSALAQQVRADLLEDYVPAAELGTKIQEARRATLQRNFLEQVRDVELLDWESNNPFITARKVREFGGEQLWNIAVIKYTPASSIFQLYVIDAWQDIRKPVFTERAQGVEVVPRFASELNFFIQNEAWYILQEIDKAFESLHPVHVSRAFVGPYESKYRVAAGDFPQLAITQKILEETHEATMLRFGRQYTFAPNHREVGGVLRQIVERQDWTDEILICPSSLAARVAAAVEGTDVRVFKMGEQ